MPNNPSQPNPPIRAELQPLLDAPKVDKPQLFLDYCRAVIKDKNNGELSLEDAGYQIAGTMFIHELDEPLFDEITTLAGQLELPGHILGLNPTEGWAHLVELIKEYGEHLKNHI